MIAPGVGAESGVIERGMGSRVWTRLNVLDLDDFSREEIEQVLETARGMKLTLGQSRRRGTVLQGQIVANVFYEPSTRTRVSFEIAARSLGAEVVNLGPSDSSVAKGESLLDTLRTLEVMGANLLVLRHPEAGAPYAVVDRLASPVVNAGDGWHAHPTQALLDLFTIQEALGRLHPLRVAIVGDIRHSRVARSNLWGMAKMGAEVVLCGPPSLLPSATEEGPFGPPHARVEHRIEAALDGADVVMALRIQRERQTDGLVPSMRDYVAGYGITLDRLKLAKPNVLVMHPGPVNVGVELHADVVNSRHSVIENQVANGVAVRMALLYLLLKGN